MTTDSPWLPIRIERGNVRPSAVITWLVAVVPIWVGDLPVSFELFGAVTTGLIFGAGLVPLVRGEDRSERRVLAIGAVQVACALATAALVPFPIASAPTPALLCVIAVPQFVFIGRDRLALAVVALQTAGLAWIYSAPLGLEGAALFAASVLGLLMFAFATSRLVVREARARSSLARAMDELSATQAALVANERLGERVRIARDLHDAVGHHLTTLSLQLDLAQRQDPEAARATVSTAHSICRVLLAELRDVLSDVRTVDADDLTRAVGQLAERLPGLQIDVDVAADLGPIDPTVAQLALRAVQEAMTNALRHAQAQRLTVALERAGERIVGRVEDDGVGFGGFRAGGGLESLRDRLRERGGQLQVSNREGHRGTGFEFSLPALADQQEVAT